MTQIELDGQTYVLASKLDAFTQLHVARKLGPAAPIVEGLVNDNNASKDKRILTVLALSHISDADTEFVIKKCLSVVVRNQPGGKAARITTNEGALMFDDITMSVMLQLTIAVIEDNLGDFFRTTLADLARSQGAAAS